MHGFSAVAHVLLAQQVTLACLLVLSGVFLWAGAVKLRRPLPSAVAAVNFGLAIRPTKSVGRLLGGTELITGIGLVVPWVHHEAALAAVTLSAGFLSVIALALFRGRRFACGCFGDDEQIGAHSLIRPGLMSLAAIDIVLAGSRDAPGLSAWCQAAILASFVVGGATLMRSRERTASARSELQKGLDWQWILQKRYPDIEHGPRAVLGGSQDYR